MEPCLVTRSQRVEDARERHSRRTVRDWAIRHARSIRARQPVSPCCASPTTRRPSREAQLTPLPAPRRAAPANPHGMERRCPVSCQPHEYLDRRTVRPGGTSRGSRNRRRPRQRLLTPASDERALDLSDEPHLDDDIAPQDGDPAYVRRNAGPHNDTEPSCRRCHVDRTRRAVRWPVRGPRWSGQATHCCPVRSRAVFQRGSEYTSRGVLGHWPWCARTDGWAVSRAAPEAGASAVTGNVRRGGVGGS